jgi:hypothetical protein
MNYQIPRPRRAILPAAANSTAARATTSSSPNHLDEEWGRSLGAPPHPTTGPTTPRGVFR